MKLKNDRLIGKRDGLWGVGFEHIGNVSDFKGKLITLIETGQYDTQELAEILEVTPNQVSDTISRLKNNIGLNIKRVYVIGE